MCGGVPLCACVLCSVGCICQRFSGRLPLPVSGGLVFCVKGLNGDHRAENLFPYDAVVRIGTADDGWRHVSAARFFKDAVAALNRRMGQGPRFVQERLHAREVRFRVQRTRLRRRIKRACFS